MLRFALIFLLLSLSAFADNESAYCLKIFPQIAAELAHQGTDPKKKLSSPMTASHAALNWLLGHATPAGDRLHGYEEGWVQPEVRELEAAGGTAWIWDKPFAAFRVDAQGRPFLQLNEGMDGSLLDHEMEHFRHWKELRGSYLPTMSPREAALKAFAIMSTPEGALVSESRAVEKELKRLEKDASLPVKQSDLFGMANYPHFSAIDEAYSLIKRLRTADVSHLNADRNLMILKLQGAVNQYADAVLDRLERLHSDVTQRFPYDFMSRADLDLFQGLGTWRDIETLFRQRLSLRRPRRAG